MPMKIAKTYSYISSLLHRVITAKLKDKGNMKRKRIMEPDDPCQIAQTIAEVPAPPLTEMLQKHKSRFGDKSKWAHLVSELSDNTENSDSD